jgi:uncharacterized membrane protein YczE
VGRPSLEGTVLLAGIALGGSFGVATLLYAVAIGPLAHVFSPVFTRIGRVEPRRRDVATSPAV